MRPQLESYSDHPDLPQLTRGTLEPLNTTLRPDIVRRLRCEVHAAAVAATSEHDFYSRITDAGLLLRLRADHNNHVTGYCVALSGHHTTAANGGAIWYSGHALGRELSLARLRGQWQSGDGLTSQDKDAPRMSVHADERAVGAPH
jgi:hypothetical protein